MSSCGGFDCAPASLCLIVSSVMWFGLHVNMELILVSAIRHRPFQRWDRSHGDAVKHDRIQVIEQITKEL